MLRLHLGTFSRHLGTGAVHCKSLCAKCEVLKFKIRAFHIFTCHAVYVCCTGHVVCSSLLLWYGSNLKHSKPDTSVWCAQLSERADTRLRLLSVLPRPPLLPCVYVVYMPWRNTTGSSSNFNWCVRNDAQLLASISSDDLPLLSSYSLTVCARGCTCRGTTVQCPGPLVTPPRVTTDCARTLWVVGLAPPNLSRFLFSERLLGWIEPLISAVVCAVTAYDGWHFWSIMFFFFFTQASSCVFCQLQPVYNTSVNGTLWWGTEANILSASIGAPGIYILVEGKVQLNLHFNMSFL